MSFDEFIKVLEFYLKDNGEYYKTFSLKEIKAARKEIEIIYLQFTEGKQAGVYLKDLPDFFNFFFVKAKNKKLLKFTKRRSYEFSSFAEEALSMPQVNTGFKQYMVFILKNQKVLGPGDIIRIFKKFNILDLPPELELTLLDTESKDLFPKISLEALDNKKQIDQILLKHYEEMYVYFKRVQDQESKQIPLDDVPAFLRYTLPGVRLIDQKKFNLLKSEEEERLKIYVKVFLFDFLKVDEAFLRKIGLNINLSLKQIREFLRFMALSLDSLEIEQGVIFIISLSFYPE